jgi:hypothetical protein
LRDQQAYLGQQVAHQLRVLEGHVGMVAVVVAVAEVDVLLGEVGVHHLAGVRHLHELGEPHLFYLLLRTRV